MYILFHYGNAVKHPKLAPLRAFIKEQGLHLSKGLETENSQIWIEKQDGRYSEVKAMSFFNY